MGFGSGHSRTTDTIWFVGPGLLLSGWTWGLVTATVRRGAGLLRTTVGGGGGGGRGLGDVTLLGEQCCVWGELPQSWEASLEENRGG